MAWISKVVQLFQRFLGCQIFVSVELSLLTDRHFGDVVPKGREVGISEVPRLSAHGGV